MEELRRKVKTGALNVVLTNEDDAEIGRFSFNPVDLNIIRRYEEVVANLEKMEVPASNAKIYKNAKRFGIPY